jgi:hypothetical protein
MKFRASLFKSLAAVLLLAVTFIHPAAAASQAQSAVTLDSVFVDVWPEYDQPSVLVIYHITLASSVTLPASMTVRIPTAVAKPYAVAMQDQNGLYDLKYTLAGAGEWIEVQFTTPLPEVRIEYYDPSLKKTGTQRDFTFRWPADYTVQNLSVKVQQPIGATNISFRPDIGAGRADSDGLTYFTLVAGKVDAGSTFDLSMGYDKATDTLTNPEQFQAAQPNQPIDANTSGRITLMKGVTTTPLQLVLLGLGLLLIIGGLLWYWQAGRFTRARADAGDGGRRRHRSAREGGEPEEVAEEVYCHQCGKKAGANDTFCRACGTKLR